MIFIFINGIFIEIIFFLSKKLSLGLYSDLDLGLNLGYTLGLELGLGLGHAWV